MRLNRKSKRKDLLIDQTPKQAEAHVKELAELSVDTLKDIFRGAREAARTSPGRETRQDQAILSSRAYAALQRVQAKDDSETECGFCDNGIYAPAFKGGDPLETIRCPYCNGTGKAR